MRLGRRCAVVLRTGVAAGAGVLAIALAPGDFRWATAVAVVALNLWSAGYPRVARLSGRWLAADAVVVCALCLAQRWTVPPESSHGSTSWVLAVVSVAVVAWQWHSGAAAGGAVTASVVLAYLAGAGLAPAALLVAAWLIAAAALSRGQFHLVRGGARAADRIMAEAERVRRVAAVAAARRADERARLAAMHDTAAALMQAIADGSVHGREPWLSRHISDALAEVTGDAGTPHGEFDLVPRLDHVVRHGPVPADLAAAGPVPLPAATAVAICDSVREALHNVARHAGVDRARVLVEHLGGRVVVEVADHGQGFDTALVPAHRRGIALSIVDRMATAGGRAEVTSSPGRGTRVRLEWPDG